MTPEETLNKIAQTIYDKKGFNIVALDVRGVSSLTDFFLIGEGSVDRHVKAIGNAVKEELNKLEIEPMHVEGRESGDWVVIDYGEILVHLFQPDLREKYALEKLWHAGKIVDLDIKVEQ